MAARAQTAHAQVERKLVNEVRSQMACGFGRSAKIHSRQSRAAKTAANFGEN
jgi:hypothetical protein